MIRRYYTRGDAVLTFLLLLLSLAGILSFRVFSGGGKHVVVEVDSRRVLELSLDKNVTTTVDGPLGETVVSVENGTVRVPESACPHGICTRMGAISYRGEIIVCAPNHVIISIHGGSGEESFDGVTQ